MSTQGSFPVDSVSCTYHEEDGSWWGSFKEWNWTGGTESLEGMRRLALEAACLHYTDWEHEDRGAYSALFLRLTGEPPIERFASA